MSELYSSSKQTLSLLLARRDALETEAFAISEDLDSAGPGGEPPAGRRAPLVDSEGFPRGDIDVHAVLEKRNRLAIINTDHKILMKQIEAELACLHSVQPDTLSNFATTSLVKAVGQVQTYCDLRPIAIIDEILPGSPADEATLQDGDLLLEFGTVNCSLGSEAMNRLPDLVRQNVNRPIKLKVSRQPNKEDIIEVEITPKSWGGRGLLGCHFSPCK